MRQLEANMRRQVEARQVEARQVEARQVEARQVEASQAARDTVSQPEYRGIADLSICQEIRSP